MSFLRRIIGIRHAPAPGQSVFNTPGAATWTCPADVYTVSVVCVGGAAASKTNTNSSAGAGLAYGNNIPVVPGTVYNLNVGAGGALENAAGGDSWFMSTSALKATGSVGITPGSKSGSLLSGGANGGAGSAGTGPHGGGGAAGYSGPGGAGAGNVTGNAGAGGAGAGGYTTNLANTASGGGGVGLLGEGTSGAAGSGLGADPPLGGLGGSNGTNGGNGNNGTGIAGYGGAYGGGAASTTTDWSYGGNGAVRIIWPGDMRQYPSTLTQDM